MAQNKSRQQQNKAQAQKPQQAKQQKEESKVETPQEAPQAPESTQEQENPSSTSEAPQTGAEAPEEQSQADAQAEADLKAEQESIDDLKNRDDDGNDQSAPSPSDQDYWDHKVAVPEGRILKEGEDVSFDGEVLPGGNFVLVKEDVYRKVYPRRSKRPTYVLLYAKNTQVATNTLQSLGLSAPSEKSE